MTSAGEMLRPLVFRATVCELRREGIALSTTQFEHQRADRLSDRGSIAGLEVVRVVESPDGQIIHHVSRPRQLTALRLNDSVEAQIDGCRRWDLSRLHSALHLVYFGFVALHGPAERCDRSVTTRSASVDLRYGEPETVRVDVLEEWLVRVVADDLLITVVTHQGRRYWHVDGIGTSACSGLHPESTRHVGDVDVAVEPHAGSGLRLSVHLARAAEPDLEESP